MDVVEWDDYQEKKLEMTGYSSPGINTFDIVKLPKWTKNSGPKGQIDGLELSDVKLTHSGYIEPLLDPQGSLASHWSKRTLKNYRVLWFKHLAPHLGHLPIETIKLRDVQAAIDKVPPTLARNCRDFISRIYSEAVREEVMVKNPAQGRSIRLPKVQKSKRPWRPLYTADKQGIMEIDLGKYQEQLRFMALHGLRPGEAAVLSQENLFQDSKNNWWIKISRTHGSSATKGRYERQMPLLCTELPSFQNWAKDPDTLTRALKPHGLTPHSLRKTAASTLFEQGVDLKTVMTWLGWKDPKLALNVYAEVTHEHELATAQKIIQEITQ
jgi:integrase